MLGYGLINADAAVKAAAAPPKDRTGAVAYNGNEHLAAPDGTPKTTHPELEQGLWMTGLIAAVAGLVSLIGGVFLARSGRRNDQAGTTHMMPPQGSYPS